MKNSSFSMFTQVYLGTCALLENFHVLLLDASTLLHFGGKYGPFYSTTCIWSAIGEKKKSQISGWNVNIFVVYFYLYSEIEVHLISDFSGFLLECYSYGWLSVPPKLYLCTVSLILFKYSFWILYMFRLHKYIPWYNLYNTENLLCLCKYCLVIIL